MPSARFKTVVALMAVLTVATYLIEPFVGAHSSEELKAAPDFALATIDNSTFALSHYNGSIVVLDFMATWCPPCRETVRELSKVRAAYPAGAVVILSVDVDYTESPSQLAAFRQSYLGYSSSVEASGWYFAMDSPGEFVGPKFDANALPALVVVDGHGKIRHSWIGVVGATQVEAAIDAAIRP